MGADGTLNHMRLLNKDIHLFLSVPNLAHQKELTNGCSSSLDLRSDLFADTPIERWQTHQT